MQQLLKTGDIVKATSGKAVKIGKYIGGGGQGEVYVAEAEGQNFALKWYFENTGTAEQRAALDRLVTLPAPSDRFLWPLQVTVSDDTSGFGYLMELRPECFKSLNDLVTRQVEPTFKALARAGFQLADSFRSLHLQGLSYRDISFGNVFLDPDTGNVLICDNDNVAFDGNQHATVNGTPRFMAPEIVRGEARPSTQTDLYSLAVLLFYMLMVHHPLEGALEAKIKCLDLPAMTHLYGTHPVFIYDPNNTSNRPDPTLHVNAIDFWKLYPNFIRALFTRSFTDGLNDPDQGRVRESEWRDALVKLHDSIIYCLSCGSENFYDRETLQFGNSSCACWFCGQVLTVPPRIRIGRTVVMLNHDSVLFQHHIDPHSAINFETPVAEVQQHPSDPKLWGLKNLSQDVWVRTTATGDKREIKPGETMAIAAGTRIAFPAADGEFRA